MEESDLKIEKLKAKSNPFHFSLFTFNFQLSTSRAVVINQLFRFLSGLSFQIFLTHSALNAVQVGVFETIIFAWVSISFFWVNAYINIVLVFLSNSKFEKSNTETFLARQFIFTSALNFIGATVFSLVFSPQIFQTAPFVFLFWGAQIFLNATNFIEPKLIAENKPNKIFEFGVLNLLLPYILLGLLIFFGANTFYAVGIFLGFSIFVFLIFMIQHLRYKDSNFNIKKIRTEFLKSVSPLIAYAATNNITTIFTQGIVLELYKLQADKFAVYRYGVRELPFTLAITNGFGFSAIGSLHSVNDLARFREGSKKILLQIFFITWLLLLTSRWTIPFIFSNKFSASISFFNLNLLLVLSRALMPQIILRAKNAQLSILYAGIAETIFIIILSVILAPKFGAMGILFSVVVGFIFEKIVLAIILKTKFNISLKNYTPIGYYGVLSFFTLLLYLWVTL